MRVIHIAENTIGGYEIVTLLANKINKTNHLHLIEKEGKEYMTGGFILNDTPEIRAVLDSIPHDKQYHFILDFKLEPFVKLYYEE